MSVVSLRHRWGPPCSTPTRRFQRSLHVNDLVGCPSANRRNAFPWMTGKRRKKGGDVEERQGGGEQGRKKRVRLLREEQILSASWDEQGQEFSQWQRPRILKSRGSVPFFPRRLGGAVKSLVMPAPTSRDRIFFSLPLSFSLFFGNRERPWILIVPQRNL